MSTLTSNVQDGYKEQLRAAGRKALEDFRRNRQQALSAGAGRTSGAGGTPSKSGAAGSLPRPTDVELSTFRVISTQAAAAVSSGLPRTGEAPQQLPSTELRALASQLSSTSLGSLPPGSACRPPPAPPSSAPCTTPGPGSVCSTSTVTSSCTAGAAAEGHAPGLHPLGLGTEGLAASPRGPQASAAAVAASPTAAAGAAGTAGAGDQALVDMLLAQVEALMRDKASLQSENAGLKQQVEQLTELVGWLSLERGEGGEGAEGLGEVADAEAHVHRAGGGYDYGYGYGGSTVAEAAALEYGYGYGEDCGGEPDPYMFVPVGDGEGQGQQGVGEAAAAGTEGREGMGEAGVAVGEGGEGIGESAVPDAGKGRQLGDLGPLG